MKDGLCKCGCGLKTGLAKQTLKASGWVKGEPLNYLPGHYRSPAPVGAGSNPEGLCKCGCGGATPLAARSGKGNVKGRPTSYLRGHQRRREWGVPASSYMVDAESGCWNWSLQLDRRGYGRTKKNGKQVGAHRAMWELYNGPVPDGLELDHLCRNPRCCNPSHLEAVTPTENKRRSRATKLTADDVVEIRASSEPQAVLADRFGVDQSNISHIRRRASWKDIGATA